MRPLPSVTAAYSAAHFAVDFGCAFAVCSACAEDPLCFLLYNFCAFALQMPLGLLADHRGRGLGYACLGGLLVAGMCCLPAFGWAGCLVLGLGNGLFHIGGGLDVLRLSGRRAAPLGVFVSPGAAGLYLGTLLGKSGFPALAAAGLVLLGTLIPAFVCSPNPFPRPRSVQLPPVSVLPRALLLFLVVVLRSYGGMLAGFSWKEGIFILLSVAAVVLGKTAGGFACDRIGAKATAVLSLLTAGALFAFGSASPAAGLLGLFLFNMTMPVTLWALAQIMPGCRAFSFGLLTFGLFLGFLPLYLGWESLSGPALGIVALLSCLLLLPGLDGGEK
ncbi:MAG: hypothetical protein ACI3U8_06350 [Candidatus Onthomonas sp.]